MGLIFDVFKSIYKVKGILKPEQILDPLTKALDIINDNITTVINKLTGVDTKVTTVTSKVDALKASTDACCQTTQNNINSSTQQILQAIASGVKVIPEHYVVCVSDGLPYDNGSAVELFEYCTHIDVPYEVGQVMYIRYYTSEPQLPYVDFSQESVAGWDHSDWQFDPILNKHYIDMSITFAPVSVQDTTSMAVVRPLSRIPVCSLSCYLQI